MLLWWLLNLMIIIPGIDVLPYRTGNKYVNNYQDYDNNNNLDGYWDDITPNSPMDQMRNEYETNNLQYLYTAPDYPRPVVSSSFKPINEDMIQRNQQRVPYNVGEMDEAGKLNSPPDDGEDKYRRLDSVEKISVYY
ncbi:unnamed protein product [Schistosoma rodhaini]|uniref:Uncharacterized protein n=1 Tax=Schistosoma mansoni TaxID=6183 RepID=G4VTG9_SCHMA|nr:hypothetical protein Smp_164400 [Schistosoma mansoni]CAH8671836.1 unnamed protein product [Schistosoma rodhaini]|eukprot:XP_018654625.1 hypothetical protein Smp_164400 [Schistosoma mansoni]